MDGNGRDKMWFGADGCHPCVAESINKELSFDNLESFLFAPLWSRVARRYRVYWDYGREHPKPTGNPEGDTNSSTLGNHAH